jgi:hypothetical protein
VYQISRLLLILVIQVYPDHCQEIHFFDVDLALGFLLDYLLVKEWEGVFFYHLNFFWFLDLEE